MEPEEVLEQEVIEQEQPADEPEPIAVRTSGRWQLLEDVTSQTFEVGKTYHIKVRGNCEFMISKDKPTAGMVANEITYTKDAENKLWIKTGV